MNKKDELIKLVSEIEEIKTYQKFEQAINSNKDLKKRFAELKSIQKQLVNAKAIQKSNAIKQFEDTYTELRNEFESEPLIETYLDLQNEINQLLIEVKEIIENEINKALSNDIFKSEN